MVRIDCNSEAIQELIEDIHARMQDFKEGEVASYIPELARAEPNDFGIAIATTDGRIYEVGDSRKPFTIQSISKPFSYGLALKLRSREHMKQKVGVEPSGEAFNAISLDAKSGVPRNPMINAGAIATAAQIWAYDPKNANELLIDFFSQLAGRRLPVDENVYRSERETGHRNRAISHLLRNFNVIERCPEECLDLYFMQCSIAVTCRDLAVMAVTLACQGRNPLTGAQPIDADISIQMLALMGTCGMYDYAGQWLHDVGMPAKSGVGGGVLAVVPGRLGIATYSPRLDPFGNSLRGIAVCEELSSRLGLHLYNQNPGSHTTIRRSYAGNVRQSRHWRSGQEAAWLEAEAHRIKIVHAQGVLDFTATEQLLAELQRITADAQVAVIDLAHVTELSPGSTVILFRQLDLLDAAGLEVMLSRAEHLPQVNDAGRNFELLPTLDLALERAENLLLERRQGDRDGMGSVTSLLDELGAEHRKILMPLLCKRCFTAGEAVLRAGDSADVLFIVESGLFSTTLAVSVGDAAKPKRVSRMATFSRGMCFGEIGFLTGGPRTADVVAETTGSCWSLDRTRFDALRRTDPDTVVELLLALSRDLGGKLVRTSHQLSLLEYT